MSTDKTTTDPRCPDAECAAAVNAQVAQVMAAAPEMYEALKRLLAPNAAGAAVYFAAERVARAAIARAEGRS